MSLLLSFLFSLICNNYTSGIFFHPTTGSKFNSFYLSKSRNDRFQRSLCNGIRKTPKFNTRIYAEIQRNINVNVIEYKLRLSFMHEIHQSTMAKLIDFKDVGHLINFENVTKLVYAWCLYFTKHKQALTLNCYTFVCFLMCT